MYLQFNSYLDISDFQLRFNFVLYFLDLFLCLLSLGWRVAGALRDLTCEN